MKAIKNIEFYKEMIKIKLNHILSAIAVVLLILCVSSVYAPLHFNGEKAERETAVKERLCDIRKAETAYRQKYGRYTDSMKQLIDSRMLKEGMQYVPYSDSTEFELSATIYRGKSGNSVPLVECSAPYEAYLNGMDEKRISELTQEANSHGEYPGLKFGDTTTPNNNAGNWE